MSSPSGVHRIFGIFEVHRTLLVERTVPTKPAFSVKKSTQSTIGGGWGGMAAWPPSEYASDCCSGLHLTARRCFKHIASVVSDFNKVDNETENIIVLLVCLCITLHVRVNRFTDVLQVRPVSRSRSCKNRAGKCPSRVEPDFV